MNVRTRLSRQHEDAVVAAIGGHQSKSSGNQWNDAADGRHDRYDEFAFAWDCKCVLPTTKSLSISREDLAKITEQARGRRPMLPLRFYASERGAVEHDWVAIKFEDFKELLERATA